MAMAGYQRALGLTASREPAPRVAGIGCTASLATDRAKLGAHRLHLAVQTHAATRVQSLVLAKGERTRGEEEHLAMSLILNLVAAQCGIATQLPIRLLPGERIESAELVSPQPWQELLACRVPAVLHGTAPDPGATPRAIFPGAFNPRHAGHRRMATIAQQLLGTPVEHEIAAINVDKPPLDFIDMQSRAVQFADTETLWFTRAATFVEKSRIFPGAWFVVGFDTIQRIAQPRYYGGNPLACATAIQQIAGQRCRFLVFGRTADGEFRTLASLQLPSELLDICQEVPAAEFRADISSSELRGRESADD
jgi:nicotinic acid mononucleotide adenylyltransferase